MSRSIPISSDTSLRSVRLLFFVLLLCAMPLRAAVRAPTVTLDGWPRGVRNTTYTYNATVRNESDEARTLCVATRRSPGLSGRVDNVTTGDPVTPQPCQPYTAGQTRTVPLTYTMANSDWDGDAVLVWVKAYDQAAPSYEHEPWFKVTVETGISAPANETLPSGQRYRRYFSIWNTDPTGTARTHDVQFSGDGVIANVQVETPSLTIPANEYRDAWVSFDVAGGGTGRLTLRAVDPSYNDRQGTAVVTHTGVSPPSIFVAPGALHGIRGVTYTRNVTLRNTSSSPRTLCLEVGRAPGITSNMDDVTQGPPVNTNVPCYAAAAGGDVVFGVRYTMANSTWDGADLLVTLKAYDQEVPASATTANFKVVVQTDVTSPPADTLGEGKTATRTFRVFNKNPFGHTYTYAMGARGDSGFSAVSVAPATAAIPAGGYADVNVTFTVAGGTAGRTGTLSFDATHTDWTSRRGFGSTQITSVAVDNTAPTVAFNKSSGTTQSTPSFQLTIDARDERALNRDTLRIYHNGADVTSAFVTTFAPPSHVQSSTTLQLAPGANTIRVTISDAAGNSADTSLNVTYEADTTAPVITFNKASGTSQSTPSFQLTIDARDERALNRDSLRIYHNGADVTSAFVTTFSPPSHVQSSTTLQLTPGANTIRVTVTDTASNAAENAVSVTYAADATKPVITFNKASGTTQSTPSFQLTIDSRDETAIAQDSLRIFHNGSDVTSVFVTTFSPPLWLQSSTTVQLNPGGNTFRVSVADSSGNAAEGTLSVTYATGTTPPPATPASKFTAYSIHASNIGNSHGIPIQYGGLDARQQRQWIHWTGCAPNWYPNGDPDLGYDIAAVHAFANANRGAHYIFLDEPAHGTVGNHRTNYTTPGCTQVTPAQYARAYRKFVDELRAVDPTARVSPGGFEQVRATEQSYPTAFVEYATEFYDSYVAQYGAPPPVVEWRFHMYWENGIWTDPSDISGWRTKTDRAIAFAQQHNAPVVIAIGYPWQGYDGRMLSGMDQMFAYLNANATVSSVFWWSYDFWQDGQNRLTTYNNEGGTARTLTVLGERYKALIANASTPPPPVGSAVSVMPDGAAVPVVASSAGTQTFTITNTGQASVTYNLTSTCTSAVVTCSAPSPSQVALAPGASAPATVSFTMAASGTGELKLTAVQSNVSSVTDSGSWQLTVTSTGGTFAIDLSPHNGENVDAGMFAANLSYTTPESMMFDEEHSVTLFYSSAQAAPSGMVQVDVTDHSATPPEYYSIGLELTSGTPLRLANGVFENFYRGASGVTRLAAQGARVDEQWPATGAYTVNVVVKKWRNGQEYARAVQPVRVLIVNERENPVGRGWSISGLQRIHVQADQSLVVTTGGGAIQYYARPAGCGSPCTYVRPAGEWSDITFDGAQYVRKYLGGSTATFSADGRLLSTSDRYSNTTEFEYTDGRLTAIVDPFGGRTTFNYVTGNSGRPLLHTVTDHGGRTSTISRDASDVLRAINDPMNTWDLDDIQYDADGRLRSWVDRAGGRWDVEYDAGGMLAATTAPLVKVDGQEKRPVTRTKSPHAAVLPPANAGTSLNDAAANLQSAQVEISVTNARGHSSFMRVDRFGAPVWVKDPVGRIRTFQRNQHSQVERTVAPNGHTMTAVWQGPLLKQTTDESTGAVIHYDYETDGWQRIKRVWGDTQELVYEYGTSPVSPLGQDLVKARRSADAFATTKYTIGDRGLVQSETDAEGHGTFYGHDLRGNVNRMTTGAVSSSYRRGVRIQTDLFGRAEKVYKLDPAAANGETLEQSTTYDLLNRVLSEANAAQQTTTLTYTGERGVKTVKDALGQVYTYNRNVLGWIDEEIDPLQQAVRYAYDSAGNMVSVTNRRNQTIGYGYDAANRMIYRDADGARTTWTYQADDRKVTVSNAESTEEFILDATGRPESTRIRRGSVTITLSETFNRRDQREQLTIAGPWSTRTIGYGYTSQGVFERLRDFNGETTQLIRNDDGLVTQTYYPRFSIIHEQGSLHTATTNHYSGLPTSTTNPGVGYNFDVLGRMSERYPAATPTRYWKYRYDPVGQLKAAEEWERAPDVCTNDPDRGYTCQPDPAYSPLPRPRRTYSYSFDANGNPSSSSGAVVKPGSRLTSYKGFTMDYDADGNLTLRYTPDWWTFNQTLTWDSLGQLTQVNGISYGYDGMGRRIRRTVAGVSQYSIYDGDDLLMEVGPDGEIHREYVHFPGTDKPHSVRLWQYGMNGATYYYATQSPGHVTGMIDIYGNVAREFRYDPFGNAEPGFENDDSQNPLRFGAREWDNGAGLYYVRNRWYSPVLERFISEDPIGLAGGTNPYAFAENDPVNFTDPSGLKKECGLFEVDGGLVIVCQAGKGPSVDGAMIGRGGQGLRGISGGRQGGARGGMAADVTFVAPAGARSRAAEEARKAERRCAAALAFATVGWHPAARGVKKIVGNARVRRAAMQAASGVRRTFSGKARGGLRSQLKRMADEADAARRSEIDALIFPSLTSIGQSIFVDGIKEASGFSDITPGSVLAWINPVGALIDDAKAVVDECGKLPSGFGGGN